MRKQQEPLIVARDDHDAIMTYIRYGRNRAAFSPADAESLESELRKAKLVDKEELPEDVVCLNATVVIQEEKAGKPMELTLVAPEKADIRQRKISFLSPIAAALIGFRKGRTVKWKVPAGLKTFRILEVRRPA